MSKRNWPDHEAVGLSISVNGVMHKIMDAKCGPMYVNTDDFSKPDAVIHGTIKLRVKAAGGNEYWLPPTDGKKLVAWAESERAKATGAAIPEEGE